MALFGGMGGAVVSLALIPLVCTSFITVYYLRLSGFMSTEKVQLRSSAYRLPGNATSDFGPADGIISANAENGSTMLSFDSGVSKTKVAFKALDGVVHTPNCATEVVLSLHRESGNSDESCDGLLIRDDIILTSRSCSRFNFTFIYLPTGDNVTAVPHISLNSNEIIDSQLGFLETNLPYHYQFIDHAVRRNRLFLSLNGTAVNGTYAAMSCFQDRPIAHSFPVNGELISLGHLHQVMPEVLWEHTDIVSAPGFILDDQRWWSRSVTLQEEKEMMMKLFEKYRGPPGSSIDIVSAHKNYMDQASAVLEAQDPRGHRSYYCYRNYYYRYRGEPPFSGENFFDWLDFGSGNNILGENEIGKRLHHMKGDKSCFEKNFNRKRIYYFNDTERLRYEVKWEMSDDGLVIVRYRQSGELVPKSRSGRHPHLYMWDLNESFYIADDMLFEDRFGGSFKHTSILASMPALSAGEIYIGANGTVFGVNYVSGHYRPSISQAALMYQWCKNQGLDLTAFHWVGIQGWSTGNCETYDWAGIKIPGYDAKSLNRSCHEVTTCPTWIRSGKAVREFNKHLKLVAAR